jgi:DNA-binding response OmpR family regulator
VRNGTARAAPPASTLPPSLEATRSLAGGRGTLLAVVPVSESARLAIVGYLLSTADEERALTAGERPAGAPAADGLVVDAAQHRVVVAGRDARLAFLEFELFAFLSANPGTAFARAHLLTRVWGEAHHDSTRTVDVHMHRLRRKLGPGYAERLVTVRRVGYMYRPSA